MKISAKTNYACRALLELSLHWPQTIPLRINVIAKNRNIPMKFLPHILIQLKQLGYVASIRGKRGGYILAKSPREITLSNVVRGFAEDRLSPPAIHPGQKSEIFEIIWTQAHAAFMDHIERKNFEEITQMERNSAKVPMYAI